MVIRDAFSVRTSWTIRLALVSVCLTLALATVPAQDAYRVQLFREADVARNLAKERNADVYAPNIFAKAMDVYLEAKDYLQRGRPLDEIQQRIHTAARYFTAATEASKSAASLFAPTMAARADAMSANAMRTSPELWEKAEKLFHAAATALEDGNPRSAKDDAGEAQGIYRAAELDAIKTNFLAPTRALLSKADDMGVKATAPQTLERARKLANLAETMIQQNRYDNTEGRRLAEEANYEAAHAIYLHQAITELRAQGRSLEDALLLAETNIGKIGTAFGTHARFDNGLDHAVLQITGVARGKDSTIAVLTDSLKLMKQLTEALQRRVSLLERREGVASSSTQGLKGEEKKKHDQTVALTSMMFTMEDGLVLKDGNNVLLRIYGLQFALGRSEIEPHFSGLLSKIQRAIRLFPNCQITIEAHTEGAGNETTNLRISEARAEAVAGALRSMLPSSTPIIAQGFGGSRPIADNTSPDGRARNRRIDIIIIPEWAIVGR